MLNSPRVKHKKDPFIVSIRRGQGKATAPAKEHSRSKTHAGLAKPGGVRALTMRLPQACWLVHRKSKSIKWRIKKKSYISSFKPQKSSWKIPHD